MTIAPAFWAKDDTGTSVAASPPPGPGPARAALDGIYLLRPSTVPWRALAFGGMLASWLRPRTAMSTVPDVHVHAARVRVN
jgi:hypothetical protein